MPKQSKKIKTESQPILVLFGNNVKKYRLRKGLTQLELSFKTGLSLTYISNIETGRANPSIIWANLIATILDVNTADLFKDF